ncbi:MAG: hypothetical protein AAF213_05640 [Pseudomonadota bacterium]
MTTPYGFGKFVRVRFPYREDPTQPGPDTKVGLVVGVDKSDPKNPIVKVAYTTTSGPAINREKDKPGNIFVDDKTARGMNQVEFMINTRRIAYVPSDKRFFPELGQPGSGIIANAPRQLRERINAEMDKAKALGIKLDETGPKVASANANDANAAQGKPKPVKVAREKHVVGRDGRPVLSLR